MSHYALNPHYLPVTYRDDEKYRESCAREAAWHLRNATSRVTPAASALYERTLAELLETGEVSEETSFLWDGLKADQLGRAA